MSGEKLSGKEVEESLHWAMVHFDELKRRGNTKEEAYVLLMSALRWIEQELVRNLPLPVEMCTKMSHYNLLATALVLVLKDNPLFDSPALHVQLEHTMTFLLRTCHNEMPPGGTVEVELR